MNVRAFVPWMASGMLWLSATMPVLAQDDDLDFLFDDEPAAESSSAQSEPPAAEESTTTSSASDEEPIETIPVAANEAAEPIARAPRGRQIEEIVVTAQKREQAIQDVPISMTALTGDFLVEQGVTDVREALQLVPNASVDAAGFFAAPRVRGFTFNNNNKSFEPPVGMVLDGIPHTRVPYFTAALFDIQRMEVLRGPQGTSFGKNTTAGLIHLISNAPTADYQGSIMVEEGELARRRVEAAFGGPLTEGVQFRIAGVLDRRDGYIRNTTADLVRTAPKTLKDRDRTGLRATFLVPELYGSTLEFAYESFELFDGGAALETISSGPNWQETIRRYDPNADFIPGNWVHSQDLADFRDSQIDRYRFKLERDIADWTLVALGAHSKMEQSLSLDTDFEPAEAINGFGSDVSPESYGELRFVAPAFKGLFGVEFLPGQTDLLFGVTASRREILDSHFTFGINNGPFYDLVAAAGADAGGSPDPGGVGGIVGGAPPNPANTNDSYDEFDQRFEQHADANGLYAHVKWQITDAWGVEMAGRYTREKKSANWASVFTTPPPNPSLEAIGTEEFTASRTRNESNVQPKLSLNWTPLDELSVFLHWEKGFKGGGFNAFAFREGNDPVRDAGFEDDDLSFGEEIATNWGLDFKTKLFDGAANLNVSLFREVARDFQVLIRENPQGTIGLGTSRVVNAEEALAQGVEADLLWLATDWLTVIVGAGFLDTEFVSFVDGECPAGNSNKDQDGDGNPRCDQSGKAFPFAPELSGALSLRVEWPLLRSNLKLTGGTLIEYESEQNLDVDLDPRKLQGAYTRLKADLGIGHLSNGWSVRLVGENLTNTVTHVRLGDVFENIVVGSQNQPRLIYLQFRQDF